MPENNPTSLSIAVVCYRSRQSELQELIASLLVAVRQLRASVELPSIPISLIDNTEDPNWSLSLFANQIQALDKLNIELRLIQGHGNVGYGSAHNLALQELTSTFHLMLNPDVTLDAECLNEGIQYLLANPDIAIVSPQACDQVGARQSLCKTYPALLTFLVRGYFPAAARQYFAQRLASFEMHTLSETEPTPGIPIVSGCFMLCRTGYLHAVGGFDENYFLYFEDFDLSLRIHQQGEIAYVPAMRIRHTGGHAARKGFRHLLLFAKSALRFYNTHGWRLFRQERMEIPRSAAEAIK